MGKDIFDIIVEKNYDQLSPQELAELAPHCSDEQSFMAMKQVLTHSQTIANGPKITPKASTKENLDTVFARTYQQKAKRPFFFHPVFQIAAVFAIILGAWFFFKNENLQTTQLARNEDPIEVEVETPKSEVEIENSTPINSKTEETQSVETTNNIPIHQESQAPVSSKKATSHYDDVALQNDFEIREESIKVETMAFPAAAPSSADSKMATSYRTKSTSADYISSKESSHPFALKVVYSTNVENHVQVLNFLVPMH